jgi:hypothetical protein
VVLGQVHVEIGGSLRLRRIVTERASSPGRSGVEQHLLRRVVHGMANHKGASFRRARNVMRIVVDIDCCLFYCSAHEIHVCEGFSDFDYDEFGWIWAETSHQVLDQATSAAVPAGSDSGRPEPESGSLKVEVGRADLGIPRQGRSTEIEGFAQGICHSHRRPGAGMDPNNVLSNRNIEQPVSVRAFGRNERPIDSRASRAERLLPR